MNRRRGVPAAAPNSVRLAGGDELRTIDIPRSPTGEVIGLSSNGNGRERLSNPLMSALNMDVRRPAALALRTRRRAGGNVLVIHSLVRAIELLRAFGPGRDRMTMAEAARAAKLTRAAARRILLTLEHLGYVRCDERHYYLTARVLELGQGFLQQPLWQLMRPAMLSISQKLNETVSAGVLDGNDVLYTVRIRRSCVLEFELNAGSRLPAFACSIGRVLLAGFSPRALDRYFATATLTRFTRQTVVDPEALRKCIETVRARGWCQVRDELETGVCGVAVPIVDPTSGATIAGMSVSSRSERTSVRAAKETLLPVLYEAASEIQSELAAASNI